MQGIYQKFCPWVLTGIVCRPPWVAQRRRVPTSDNVRPWAGGGGWLFRNTYRYRMSSAVGSSEAEGTHTRALLLQLILQSSWVPATWVPVHPEGTGVHTWALAPPHRASNKTNIYATDNMHMFVEVLGVPLLTANPEGIFIIIRKFRTSIRMNVVGRTCGHSLT